jgi:hypothetical protein
MTAGGPLPFPGADMTHDEFRRQYEDYPWDPYHPLAVILTTGPRVYIDKPEQVALAPDELVITRRVNPRKPEHYRYADIAQLVPLLELPADPGGLSYAEFDPLIRRLLMADPFEPFVIELRTGAQLRVNSRPDLSRAGRHLTLFGRPRWISTSYTYDQVARLIPKAETVVARPGGE